MKFKSAQNSSELRNLWVQVYHTSDGIQFTSKSVNKFKKINNCITGHELVEWLMKKKSVSKDQAIVIGQALIDGKWLELVHQANVSTSSLASYYSQSNSKLDQIFYDDNSLYKPGPVNKKIYRKKRHNFIFIQCLFPRFQASTNCNRLDPFEKTKVVQDTDEGPEWIKELNKLVTKSAESNKNLYIFLIT